MAQRNSRTRFAWTSYGVTTAEHSATVLEFLKDGIHDEADYRGQYPTLTLLVWQAERCPDTQRDHLQGYARFSENTARDDVVLMLENLFGAHPHVEGCKAGESENRDYVTKEDSRIHGPYTFGTWENNGGKRTDLVDLRAYIATLDNPRDVYAAPDPDIFTAAARLSPNTIELIWQSTRPAPSPIAASWPAWSGPLLTRLMNDPSPREIFFLIGPPNSGKTLFCLKLLEALGNSALKIGSANPREVFSAWSGQPMIILDLPMAVQRLSDSMCEALEDLKTGVVFSTKYVTTMKRHPIPHILVVTNHEMENLPLAPDRIVRFRSGTRALALPLYPLGPQ